MKPCLACKKGIGAPNQWEHCYGCLRKIYGISVQVNGRVANMSFLENRDFRKKFREQHGLADKRRELSGAAYGARRNTYLDDFRKPPMRASTKSTRRCLGPCEKDFLSDGPHNRLCVSCKNTDAWEHGNIHDYSTGGGLSRPRELHSH